MRDYELVFIVAPTASEEETKAITDRVTQLITNNGGQLNKVDHWGRRKLAYPIGAFQEGVYIATEFTLEPKKASELESALTLSESVIRHLLVRKE